MCTVSYINTNGKRILTSNRDEHISRPVAEIPKEEIINNCRVLYPKDPKAGGTWFAINENGIAAVLLNGAFQKHKVSEEYRMSRGVVLLNIISNAAPAFHFAKLDLELIEPFTVILFEHQQLLELRWDGLNKYRRELNIDENYIWSSVTLYDSKAIKKREVLFKNFLASNEELDEEIIIDFHSNDYDDQENGFIINRQNQLKTFSITQAIFEPANIKMNYYDLISDELHSITVSPNILIDPVQ